MVCLNFVKDFNFDKVVSKSYTKGAFTTLAGMFLFLT